MKVGDCVIDVDSYGGGIDCGCSNGGNNNNNGDGNNSSITNCTVDKQALYAMLDRILE